MFQLVGAVSVTCNLKTTIYSFIFSNSTKSFKPKVLFKSFEHFFCISIIFSQKYLQIQFWYDKKFRYEGSNIPPVCNSWSTWLTNYLEMLIRLHGGHDLPGLCWFSMWLLFIFQGHQAGGSAKRSHHIICNLIWDKMLTSCH